ncbi:3'-5'-exodeoxyribonuclease [Ascoidea rubescens DSM 1968]|uniref:Metallo-dependent hydrolase n=1 Tax=Ascoidea rubescens DSM 1968 TaxID=1344418 RepID=A0A1D2VM78_9ASCO|nr:Metallo-dependent hydrolase [Ascoidea rubescens DSM 1968]ODV62709.1 Metallo-dependent hydrolase [Ascoidea rubescens DSM 1968]
MEGKKKGIVKAFGEIGLDYDRLFFSSKELQQEYFKKQLEISIELELPLFLHLRASTDDFIQIIKPYLSRMKKNGVIHSFTGTEEELNKFLELGFYVSVNGCSFKTDENLKVASKIPLDKLLIETDAPWCEIKRTHPSYKYLTQYPNFYYPKVKIIEEEIKNLANNNNNNNKIKTKGRNKEPKINYHEFLPFPNIKKEHYNKFFNSDNFDNNSNFIDEFKFKLPLIKSRNEPVCIGFVAEVMSKLKDVEPKELIETCYLNSCKLFELEENDN